MFMFICSLRELWADVMIPSLHFARKVVPRYGGQNFDNFLFCHSAETNTRLQQ